MSNWNKVLIPVVLFIAVFVFAGYATSRDVPQDSKGFTFALTGDIPRLGDAELEPDLLQFNRLKDEINDADVAFVVHDGDFKSGSSPCSDDYFYRWRDLINTFDAPFFFISGDNDWTDCHRESAGGYDPLERLTLLRQVFYSAPQSLGKHRLPMERQSDKPSEKRFRAYVDNFRWIYGNIMFVGLNVQGSNNNLGRTPEMDAEFRERNDAVNNFMRESFETAKENGILAIVITIQANPGFEQYGEKKPSTNGYHDFLTVLREETLAFNGKPVVLVHGDTHYFRIDKPMKGSKSKRRIENFTRVETFGAPDVHWILATVDYDNPGLFVFEPRIVKGNIIDHWK